MNDLVGTGTKGQTLAFCSSDTTPANMPANFQNKTRFYAIVYNSTGQSGAYDVYQKIIPRDLLGNTFERYRSGSTWSNWKEISTDIPAFYKDYNALSNLATAVGANLHIYSRAIPNMESGAIVEFSNGYSLIKVGNRSSGNVALFIYSINDGMQKIFGSDNIYSTTKDTAGKVNVYGISEYKFEIQQNMTTARSLDIQIFGA